MIRNTLVLAAAALSGAALATPAAAQNEQFVPILSYRTGAYAVNGVPYANGVSDYYNLVNERDGGINGVKLLVEECETGYATDKGVECYERLKGKGPTGAAFFNPLSTGITFALTEKTHADKIPDHHHGIRPRRLQERRRVLLQLPAARHLLVGRRHRRPARRQGAWRCRQAQGQEDHASSFTTAPTARSRSRRCRRWPPKHGFEFTPIPVTHPGVEQKSQWLAIRQNRPDYVLLWGWGVMNGTAVKEAAAVAYPRDKMIGVWWSGAEPDVTPAGDDAKGYKALMLQHGAGKYKVHEDIKKHVLDKGKGLAKEDFGQVLYNRGVVNAMLGVEAIRKAQEKFGKKPLTGEQVRWGLENLNLSDARLKELGFEGMLKPIKITCADHEGARDGRVQQWDGKEWKIISDWYTANQEITEPLVKDVSAKYAAEKKIEAARLLQGELSESRTRIA